jgi:hypothetical protein
MFSGPAIGIYSSSNPFTQTPSGTLKRADNVRFTDLGVLAPRRGFDVMTGGSFGDADSRADALASYAGAILAAYDLTKVSVYQGTRFTDFQGDFEPVGSNRMRFEGAARSMFWNPSSGLTVWDGAGKPLAFATVTDLRRALAYTGGVGTIGTSGAIAGDTSSAEGTIVGTGYSNAAGTVFFASPVSGGPFQAEGLTGDGGWTGTSPGADVPALQLGELASEFTTGRGVIGISSGATATIRARFESGGVAYLALENVTGAFAAEEVFAAEAVGGPRLAGCSPGLSMSYVLRNVDGWQTADTAVAYRYTICTKDVFGRIIEGPPSGRLIVQNFIFTSPAGNLHRTGGNLVHGFFTNPNYRDPFLTTASGIVTGGVVTLSPGEANFPAGSKTTTDVDLGDVEYSEAGSNVVSTLAQNISITSSTRLTVKLPADVDTTNFIRLYRSHMTAHAIDSPSDELFLVFESPFLTATDLAAGTITVDDTTPESVLDFALYTNVNTGVGPLQANYRPPKSLDIAYWGNRMWFGNTSQRHSLRFTVLGVGSPDGVQTNDTFSIKKNGATSIEFVANGVSSNGFSAPTHSAPGTNIQNTAESLVDTINDLTANDFVDAYYVSSEGGLPGSILLVAREFGDANSFQLFSSRSTAWSPQLPTETAPDFPAPFSVDDAHPAGISYSRLGLPEAVPPTNSLVINSDNDAILRIFPLHYRMLVFKTDGIYAVTNVEPFSVQRISSYVLLSPDSVCLLEDRVYALTDQGLIVVSDSGVEDISDPIDAILRRLDVPDSETASLAFGLGYRSERQVLLWLPEIDDLGAQTTDNEQAFVYSALARGYTRFSFGVRTAMVDPVLNRLVVAPTDDNALWLERKALTSADFADVPTNAGVVTSVSGDAVTVPSTLGVTAGDVLSVTSAAGDGKFLIIAVTSTQLTALGSAALGITGGDAYEVLPAIDCAVELNKLTNGTPADLKMSGCASLLFRQNGVRDTTAQFSSELVTDADEVVLSEAGFGDSGWGESPWGNPTQQIRRVEPLPEPTTVAAQLSVGFETRQACAGFEFLGFDVKLRKDSEVNYG